MFHRKQPLLNKPMVYNVDLIQDAGSDIQQDPNNKEMMKPPTTKPYSNPRSLLGSVILRKRVEPRREVVPLCIQLGDSEEQSAYIYEKTGGNIRKRPGRMVNVPNRVKLQRRDQIGQECAICLNDLRELQEKQKGRLLCKHVFCVGCILESSKFANRCPYCRATFTEILNDKKSIKVAETRLNEQFEDPEDEPCYVCGRNDDFDRLLECQFCQYAYCHTYCDVRLNSDRPPVESWYCLSCEDLIRHQNRYGPVFQSDSQEP